MDILNTLSVVLHYAVLFIPVLGVLVFIHEFGHFLAAKWAGVRIERFSLGFPPRLFGKRIGETDYCISAVPLGGYVKMAGMIDESLDTKIEGHPWEFMSKPVWKRAIVIAAGPLMNVFLALFVLTALYFFYGVRETTTTIDQVIVDSPAAAIGLQSNDKILMVDGKNISMWEEVTTIINPNVGKEIVIEWARNGERMRAAVIPCLDTLKNRGLLGVVPKQRNQRLGFQDAATRSYADAWAMTQATFHFIGQLFVGKESAREGLAGPLVMAKIVGQAAQRGFDVMLILTAFISLQLAILNILPIPVLDGGHLLFLLLESILRRPVSLRIRVMVQQLGMAFLLVLMVFVLFNDVQKLIMN